MKSILYLTLAMLFVTACNRGEAVNTGPADRSATTETVNMLAGLKLAAGQGIMFGHQDDLSYGIGWIYPGGESDVKESQAITRLYTAWISVTLSTGLR
jgi:mannan endo-1,4-beta-mannosidase